MFRTRPRIALGEIRERVERAMTPGLVGANFGYDSDILFRKGLDELGPT